MKLNRNKISEKMNKLKKNIIVKNMRLSSNNYATNNKFKNALIERFCEN